MLLRFNGRARVFWLCTEVSAIFGILAFEDLLAECIRLPLTLRLSPTDGSLCGFVTPTFFRSLHFCLYITTIFSDCQVNFRNNTKGLNDNKN